MKVDRFLCANIQDNFFHYSHNIRDHLKSIAQGRQWRELEDIPVIDVYVAYKKQAHFLKLKEGSIFFSRLLVAHTKKTQLINNPWQYFFLKCNLCLNWDKI